MAIDRLEDHAVLLERREPVDAVVVGARFVVGRHDARDLRPTQVAKDRESDVSFMAHLVVSKCAHSIPQYRLEKEYRNLGIPMSRSTMCSLLHRAAKELRPLYDAALATVADSPDVHADETSVRQQDRAQRSFLWTFVTKDVVAYTYAPSRSGETPLKVLGSSSGRLVVDQHTGYNAVTKPGGRVRAGCLAHYLEEVVIRSGDSFARLSTLRVYRRAPGNDRARRLSSPHGTVDPLAERSRSMAREWPDRSDGRAVLRLGATFRALLPAVRHRSRCTPDRGVRRRVGWGAAMASKKDLSDRDICTKFIAPALVKVVEEKPPTTIVSDRNVVSVCVLMPVGFAAHCRFALS